MSLGKKKKNFLEIQKIFLPLHLRVTPLTLVIFYSKNSVVNSQTQNSVVILFWCKIMWFFFCCSFFSTGLLGKELWLIDFYEDLWEKVLSLWAVTVFTGFFFSSIFLALKRHLIFLHLQILIHLKRDRKYHQKHMIGKDFLFSLWRQVSLK